MNVLANILNESYDVEIKVGVDNIMTFKAHSNISKARSLYFKMPYQMIGLKVLTKVLFYLRNKIYLEFF